MLVEAHAGLAWGEFLAQAEGRGFDPVAVVAIAQCGSQCWLQGTGGRTLSYAMDRETDYALRKSGVGALLDHLSA
ncbi:hypothetical protein [Sphingomonas morindae]|uniref:Uncharacterized protein n=1 Tax=Sphingomonas morindae TaxID=1541170 RepID=A0ABY4X9E0_9SPHN|nr:hypothetical protein [Sphingomonas morindae]USI73474.1 hypothetical protein LHA26_03045 [Sphingomonas morindae]